MMRFIVIKDGVYNFDTIKDIIKSLVGNNIKAVNKGNNSVFYHNYSNDEEIRTILGALETELMVNMYAYISDELDDDKVETEISIALKLLDHLPHGIYNFKEALLKADNIPNSEEILEYILRYTGVNEDFIKDFADCDLNVSRASKKMNFHRNTTIYKLDKLSEISGFDLRCFKDAYILYMLVNSK